MNHAMSQSASFDFTGVVFACVGSTAPVAEIEVSPVELDRAAG
jgi:hypothetical protein